MPINVFIKNISYLLHYSSLNNVIYCNPSTGKLFKTPPIIAYRQPLNLKRILIHSKVSNTTTTIQGNP